MSRGRGKRQASTSDESFVGQGYGERAEQERFQAALPTPPEPMPAIVPPPTGPLVSLSGPTMRADEPIQAGLMMGPGPGPEALGLGGSSDPLDELRALYSQFRYEEIREIIEELESP